jgi:hypothetical protein
MPEHRLVAVEHMMGKILLKRSREEGLAASRVWISTHDENSPTPTLGRARWG